MPADDQVLPEALIDACEDALMMSEEATYEAGANDVRIVLAAALAWRDDAENPAFVAWGNLADVLDIWDTERTHAEVYYAVERLVRRLRASTEGERDE